MAQENSDASARGAFIFINDIMCLSSTEDGQFRPSDVFGRQELTSSKAPALDCLASRQQQWGDPATPRRSAYTNYISTHEGADIKTLVKAAKELGGFDMDCPIFHAFGVLSGGVLMDPVGSTVVDVGDESAATPATFSCLSDNKEIQRKHEQQRKSNHSLFLEGRTDEVKAEAAWVLASSRQPLERSPSLPFDRGLQGEAPRSEFDGNISVGADERCRALWSRCGPLGAKFPTTSSKESDDAQHDVAIRWMHLEEFRRYAHCDYGGDAWITSDYADYYSYQYGGTYPTRLVGDQPLTKREDEDDVGVVHSPASPNTSFTCFAGRSARSYAPTYMKAWGRARVRFLRWNLRKHSQDGKPDFVPLRPPTMGELCAAYHHRPYRTRWQTFWIVFARFFPFLGIRRSSSAKEYSFHDASGNPIPFSARECLRASIVKTTSEKQQVEQKLIKRKRSREEMKNEPTQDESTANVFTAWQYLHLHELPELERRMAKLVRYLSNHMPQYQS